MSDIGGKIEPKDDEASLSIISLRWMVHQIVQASCGIEFDRATVSAILPDCLPLVGYPEAPAAAAAGNPSKEQSAEPHAPTFDGTKERDATQPREAIQKPQSKQDPNGSKGRNHQRK